MIKNLIKYFLIAIIFGFYSCTEDPASIGSSQIPSDIVIGEISSLDDSLQQNSTYFKKEDLDRGVSSNLFLGSYDDISANMLLRFIFALPDSIESALANDSLNVLSAKISLYPIYELGDGSTEFSVHKINSSWTESGFDTDSLNALQYDAADLSMDKTVSDSVISFSVPNDLVFNWLKKRVDDTVEDNNGLLFQPNLNSQKILGFKAFTGDLSNADLTEIEIVFEKTGEYRDTIIAKAFPDVYTIEGELPQSNENIFVQGGIAIESNITFDISQLSKSSIINNAELQLFLDQDKSYVGNPTADSVWIRIAIGDSTSSSGVIFRRIDNYFAGSVTGYVERWLSGDENKGLNVSIYNELNTVSRFAFYGSDVNDSNLKPRLKIYYTTLK